MRATFSSAPLARPVAGGMAGWGAGSVAASSSAGKTLWRVVGSGRRRVWGASAAAATSTWWKARGLKGAIFSSYCLQPDRARVAAASTRADRRSSMTIAFDSIPKLKPSKSSLLPPVGEYTDRGDNAKEIDQ